MRKNDIPAICTVTDKEYDLSLIQDIADIERLVQPFDSWNERILTDLLGQDINDCWAVLDPDFLDNLEPTVKDGDEGSDTNNIDSDNMNNEDSCKVIAYCIFSKVFEVAEILRIGTHPDFQRQGYAEWLIKLIIKHMPNKGIEKILLEVREDNTAAIKLYKKMGFKEIHRRVGYYKSKGFSEDKSFCDALVMQYSLTDEHLKPHIDRFNI